MKLKNKDLVRLVLSVVVAVMGIVAIVTSNDKRDYEIKYFKQLHKYDITILEIDSVLDETGHSDTDAFYENIERFENIKNYMYDDNSDIEISIVAMKGDKIFGQDGQETIINDESVKADVVYLFLNYGVYYIGEKERVRAEGKQIDFMYEYSRNVHGLIGTLIEIVYCEGEPDNDMDNLIENWYSINNPPYTKNEKNVNKKYL